MNKQTWIGIVKEEAKAVGLTIGDDTADSILWERTGFPCFWNTPEYGATPEECCRTQVREFFARARQIGMGAAWREAEERYEKAMSEFEAANGIDGAA